MTTARARRRLAGAPEVDGFLGDLFDGHGGGLGGVALTARSVSRTGWRRVARVGYPAREFALAGNEAVALAVGQVGGVGQVVELAVLAERALHVVQGNALFGREHLEHQLRSGGFRGRRNIRRRRRWRRALAQVFHTVLQAVGRH